MTPERIGPYRIDELLGRGGMGEVYKAYDEKLRRHVAIKLIRGAVVRVDTLKRFLREARTAAQLSHPAIVQIYHVEEVAGDDCIVMELVAGQPLSTLIRDGPLEPPQCLELACQIADGLAEAHSKDIVHRDLKTENVMVTREGRAKILDFGLARPLPSITDSASDELIGTPRAMSPEQANELRLDARSDLFAFGTLLYEMTTGESPFRGRTPLAVLHQVCFHQPPSVRELNPDVPLDLAALISQLHEKQPDNRPPSARAVLERLTRIRAAAAPTLPALKGRQHLARAVSPGRPPAPCQPSPVLHDERRQITLLSCRVSPEETVNEPSILAPGFLTAASEAVQRHLGSILHATPSEMVGCFGYPRAHEDDACRAVRAALGVVEHFRSDTGFRDPGLRLRLALHTGVVEIPGGRSEAEVHEAIRDDSGELWARVSRLRAKAEPSRIWVTPATHRLIRDQFHCHGLREAGEPEAYQIRSRVDRRGVALPGDLPKLVARREELSRLEERWKLASQGRGQVVLVSGDAGIGKTRLLGAFREHLGLGAEDWWSCRSSPRFQNSAFRGVIALLWQLLATERGATLEEHRSSLEELLAEHGLSVHLPLWADLLALPLEGLEAPNPQTQAQRTLEAALELLLAVTARRPRVWVVEDLHWTDPSTLEVLDRLIDQAPTTRLLLLLSFRPRFRPPWSARTYLTPLVLSGLDAAGVRELVRQRSEGRALPPKLEDQIVELTDGVPLFVEELTRLVIDAGLVEEVDDRYELREPEMRLAMPTTLRDALTARLDRLGSAKQVAQLAAVFGRELSLDVLRAVSPFGEQALDADLERLVEAELLYRRGVSRIRFVFKHALIQQAAYRSLTRGKRREYHAAIAQALEEEFSDTVRLHPEILAHHFTEAGQTEKAAFFWLQAGRKAWAKVEAVQHLEKGLRLLAELPASDRRNRLELHFQSALGPTLMAMRGFSAPEVKSAYDRVLELGQLLGEVPDFETLWGYWRFYSTTGDWAKALELARKLESLAEADRDATQLTVALRSVGGVLFHTGRLEAAREVLERAIAIPADEEASEFSFVHHPRVNAQAYAAWVLWQVGFPDRALAIARDSIALAQRLDEPFTLALALGTGCLIHRLRREDEDVLEISSKLVELTREHQFGLALAGAKLFHGGALAATLSPAEGLAEMREGLDAWTAAKTGASLTFILGDVARACLDAGEIEQGLETIRRALAIVEAGGESFFHAELLRLAGELLRRGGRESEAEEHLERAWSIANAQGALAFELRAALSLGSSSGNGRRIRDAHQRFREGFETRDLREAASYLGSGDS